MRLPPHSALEEVPTAASGLATWLCSEDIPALAVESNSFASTKDSYQVPPESALD